MQNLKYHLAHITLNTIHPVENTYGKNSYIFNFSYNNIRGEITASLENQYIYEIIIFNKNNVTMYANEIHTNHYIATCKAKNINPYVFTNNIPLIIKNINQYIIDHPYDTNTK